MKKDLSHIIKACQRKEKKAQQSLYNLFVDRLYYVVLRYVNDTFYTQNVLQDVFFKAFKNIDSFDEKIASFNTWITTIAIRESISHCRKKSFDFSPIENMNIPTSDLENILSQLQAEELLKVIAKIPDKFRVVFNLYEIDGFKHHEIAEILGISEGTSRSYLTRAKQQLRKKLAPIYSFQGIAK